MVRPQDWKLDQDLPREMEVVRLDLYLLELYLDLYPDLLHLVDLYLDHPDLVDLSLDLLRLVDLSQFRPSNPFFR